MQHDAAILDKGRSDDGAPDKQNCQQIGLPVTPNPVSDASSRPPPGEKARMDSDRIANSETAKPEQASNYVAAKSAMRDREIQERLRLEDERYGRHSVLAGLLTMIDRSEVDLPVRSVQSVIQSLHYNMLDQAGLEFTLTPHWVPQPSPDLQEVYRKVFGVGGSGKATQLALSVRLFDRREALQALLSATMWYIGYERPLPDRWLSAPDVIPKLGPLMRPLNHILKDYSSILTADLAIWRAVERQARGGFGLEADVAKEAEDRAGQVMAVLQDQFEVFGLKGKPVDWDMVRERLTHAMKKVLNLKLKLRAAGDYYFCSWIESGAPFDEERMVNMQEGAVGDQEVLWCIAPFIGMRETKPTEGHSDLVAMSKARVFTKPMRTEGSA